MGPLRLDRLVDLLHGNAAFWALWGLGLTVLVVGLVVLIYTRWGQFHPLHKSLALSLLAHLLLALFTTTIAAVPSIPLFTDQIIHVSIADKSADQKGAGAASPGSATPGPGATAPKGKETGRSFQSRPWESFGHAPGVRAPVTDMARVEPGDTRQPMRETQSAAVGLGGTPPVDQLPLADAVPPQPDPLPAADAKETPKPTEAKPTAEPIQAPAAQRREGARTGLPGKVAVARAPGPDVSSSEPVRASQAGLPTKLLERTLSVPRMDEVAVVLKPDSTLPAVAGRMGTPSLKPAAPTATRAPGTSAQVAGTQGGGFGPGVGIGPTGEGIPGGDPAGSGTQGAGIGPSVGGTGHLRPPSLAAGGSGMGGPGKSGAGMEGDPAGGPGGGGGTGIGPPQLPGRAFGYPDHRLPDAYRLRVAPDRARLAERFGATEDTEKAVQAALKWFSETQSSDGHWDPKKYDAGREAKIADHDRYGAGSTADTGLSGLATLTFLAAGNTHLEGTHQATTRRALEYLLRAQGTDGNLAGDAAVFEFMYCHGMATIALSEAYGMTRDPRLREPVRRAVAYILAAQDPSGGGWRYKRQEPGDTSQLGWQLLALKSAELAGISVPPDTWKGVNRFLKNVSSGQYGGLASYRPNEQVNRTMTAEALMCRQFLGLTPETMLAQEAGNHLLAELPGDKKTDFYYLYYGTLAMYQLQGIHWQRWDEAMKNTLVATQHKTGPLAGSWDPDNLWGAYGGRLYSTSLATLCLEVYYRFLPLSGLSPQEPPAK